MRKIWLPVLAIVLLCVGTTAFVLAILPFPPGGIANTPTGLPTLKPTIANTEPAILPTPVERSDGKPTAVLALVNTTALHVRSGPGIAYPVIGWLHAGDAVTVLACRAGWARLASGWVNSRYLNCDLCKENRNGKR